MRGNSTNREYKSYVRCVYVCVCRFMSLYVWEVGVVVVWVCIMQILTWYEPGQVANWSRIRKLGG